MFECLLSLKRWGVCPIHVEDEQWTFLHVLSLQLFVYKKYKSEIKLTSITSVVAALRCWKKLQWRGLNTNKDVRWKKILVCTLSQNHRMVGFGRDLCGSSSPVLCWSRVTYSRLHRTLSRWVLIPAQPLPLLGFFSLGLVRCAWTTIPWHSNLHPFLWHPWGVQPACSLPAASLSFTASLPGKRGKAEPGDRGEAEQSWKLACEWQGHHCLSQGLKCSLGGVIWGSPHQQCLKELLVHYSHYNLWPFKPFCLFQATTCFVYTACFQAKCRRSQWDEN